MVVCKIPIDNRSIDLSWSHWTDFGLHFSFCFCFSAFSLFPRALNDGLSMDDFNDAKNSIFVLRLCSLLQDICQSLSFNCRKEIASSLVHFSSFLFLSFKAFAFMFTIWITIDKINWHHVGFLQFLYSIFHSFILWQILKEIFTKKKQKQKRTEWIKSHTSENYLNKFFPTRRWCFALKKMVDKKTEISRP